MNNAMISPASLSRPLRLRAFRFSLVSLLLLALVLAAGWAVFSVMAQWAGHWDGWQHAIEVDGQTIHLGDGDPLTWLLAGFGLLAALVVVIVAVPIVLVVALAVPVLLVLAVLAVPLLLAAVVLSPILLLLWLLWKLIT
jgi:hypothetical protein